IIERAVAIAGARIGPVALEAALFNGDEPTGPGSWPRISRFGDSWSARVTVFPVDGLELQGSRAVVESPEHRPGSGLDQSKWSASARWERAVAGHPVYGLVEWERTGEANGFNRFESLLGEAAWRTGRHRIGYRFERTERPEEERTLSRWRSPRPLLDNSLLGITRWTIHTAGYSVDLASGESLAELQPFVEVSYGKVRELRRGGFDPLDFYGQNSFWSVSLGMRLGWGGMFHRMGRYGVVAASEHQMMGRH
ncbi:MAG TPA: hypothetical protein VFL95_07665, partial [Gemmatimonadales bacterium]|nr:hypothetical protein [Gemmatimonadales bacterium]